MTRPQTATPPPTDEAVNAEDETIELARRPAFVVETEDEVDEAARTQLYMRIPDLVAKAAG